MTLEQRIKRIEETVSGKKSLKETAKSGWKYEDHFSGVFINVSEEKDNRDRVLKGTIEFSRCRSFGINKEQFEEALIKFCEEIGVDV